MPRPTQRAQIYAVQDRRSTPQATRPWVVRWSVEGRHRSRSFRLKAEAERYRSELFRAVADGQRFDPLSGEPAGWGSPLATLGLHQWARRWLEGEWPEWAPRTRGSAAEAVARFVSLAVDGRSRPPTDVRLYLRRTLGPDSVAERDDTIEAWLERHILRLEDLDRERVRTIAHALMLRVDGTPLAPSTAARFRATCHACLLAAVDVGALEVDPWPRRTRSASRRKALRKSQGVDIRSLPSPETMDDAIASMANDHPGSLVYQAMTAVAYYSGLRPSEVVMLRVRSLDLPDIGWGRIAVTEADDGTGHPGEPKTGRRDVPIPPLLVRRLSQWVADRGLRSHDAFLFRTDGGSRPNQQNWNRAWKLALEKVGHPPLRVYDCRHAAATTWLAAGVPLGEVARRLGHSVDTLVTNYVGALQTDEAISNTKIDSVLEGQPGTGPGHPTPSGRAHLTLLAGGEANEVG